jgi:hypothetical protein
MAAEGRFTAFATSETWSHGGDAGASTEREMQSKWNILFTGPYATRVIGLSWLCVAGSVWLALGGVHAYPVVMLLTLICWLSIPESYISEATRWTCPTFSEAG